MRETSQLGVRVSRERYTMILTSSPRLKRAPVVPTNE